MLTHFSRIMRLGMGALLCGALLVASVPGLALGAVNVAAVTQLTGTVTDVVTGLPIRGALVAIGDGNYNYRTYTDTRGRYSITGGQDPYYTTYVPVPMPTGTRVVYMWCDGYEEIAKQVVLTSGKTTTADAELGRARQEGILAVTVRNSNLGYIDSWVSIYRSTPDGPKYVTGEWITAGQSTVGPHEFTLPTGSYYVWATGPGWDGLFAGGSASLAAAVPVSVGPKSNPHVEVNLMSWSADAPFDVTVKSSATGDVLPGMRVSLTDIGPLGEEVWEGRVAGTTNATGHFTGMTGGASHRLKFSDPSGHYATEYFNDAVLLDCALPIEWHVSPFNATGELDVAATVAGSNRDNTDAAVLPVEGGETVTLYALSPSTSEWTEVSTAGWNADGTYTLGKVHPGTYRLGSERLNGTSGELEQTFHKASGSAATIEDADDVVIAAGSTATGIDFSFGDPIPLPDLRMLRVEGESRYGTALEASRANFSSSDTVILATGSNFPDALSASALAGAYEAPLLLTETARLTQGVADEIVRLGTTRVVLIGSTAAVSAAVEASVDAIPRVSVERVSGINRYDTSAMVARRVAMVLGVDTTTDAFLVRGDNFADALSASSLAYRNKMPVLLTETNALRAEADRTLSYLGVQHVVIVGSTKAVGAKAAAAVTDNHPSVTTERVYGTDRYATSAALATWGATHGYCGTRFMGFATGLNYPDALGGGAAAGARNGVLLLTDPKSLSPSAKGLIVGYGTRYTSTQVFGSPVAVSESVKTAIEAALPN